MPFPSELLYRIPVDAQFVLFLGEDTIKIADAYSRINPDAEVTCHSSYQPSSAQYDCIVCLELLRQDGTPESNFQNICSLLLPTGTLILYEKNVQFWRGILALLASSHDTRDFIAEQRQYSRQGFLLSDLRALVKEFDLHLYDISPCQYSDPEFQNFVNLAGPLLQGLGIDEDQFVVDTFSSHFILRAGYLPHQPLLINALLLPAQAGLNEVRVLQPLRSIGSYPSIRAQASHKGFRLLPPDDPTPRVLILQRQIISCSDSIELVKSALQANYVLISEFDDNPDFFPEQVTANFLTFRSMHAVQVSTPRLAKRIAKLNPEVFVLDNTVESLPHVDESRWPATFNSDQPLRFFFGALNREQDWKPWFKVLNQFFVDNQESIHVQVVHDSQFYDALATPNKSFSPLCDYSTYRKLLSQSHMAFLPLACNDFNLMKSDLKYIEASSHGVVSLASPTVYADSIKDTSHGLIFSTEQELSDFLHQSLDDSAWLSSIAERAYSWVRTNRLQKHVSNSQLDWYRSLWNRRHSLTQALISRCPELSIELPT